MNAMSKNLILACCVVTALSLDAGGWPPRPPKPGPFRVFADDADYLRRKFRENVTDPKTGLDNDALKQGVAELAESLKTNGVPWRMVKARAVEYVLKNMAIDVSPRDWFPAIACWNRWARPVNDIIWRRSDEITRARRAQTAAAAAAGNAEGKWTMWRDFDHSVPEWSAIIPLGYPGMKRRLLDHWRETPYYAANLVMIDACDAFLERLATQGELVARGVRGEAVERGVKVGDPERVRRQVKALRALRAGPPQTTYEALMFLWTYFFIGEHAECMQVRSLSALDLTLTPFYRADLAAGRITEAEFRELLRHFWWQWGSVDNYWCQPVALGGTKPDGSTEFNEVTKIILDVHDELALPTPKVLVKTAPNTPDWAWEKMLDMHRRHRSLVYVGEQAIAKKGRASGWSEDEIRNAVLGGCYEVGRPRAAGCGAGHMNLLMPVQRILEDAVKGTADLPTFEAFLAEYERRLRRETAACRDLVKSWELDLDEINPSLMFSLATDYSVKTGKDAFMHGTEFGRGSVMMQVGLGTTVDALLAVKELVYERRELTPAELGKVMAANWQGHETLRLRMLRSKRKWGNNSPESNALGKRVIRAFTAELKGQKNLRGGAFSASGHCARQFIEQGRKTGATPDGRLAGEELSKNLSPTPGADTEGVTALINTITTLDYAEDVPGDMPVDVALNPATVAGDKGLRLMRQIVETYHQLGGAQIHFNVFDPEELREAQRHPERYANLQVRVCGWNVRWNDLSKAEQDAYIRRAEAVAH